MDETRALLRHFLAALAYRTQKALRGAPEGFAGFRAAPRVRTPHELVRHMSGVLNYALTAFGAGEPAPLDTRPEFEDEVRRFHAILAALADHLRDGPPVERRTAERLLQGPFSDAMTHAGQLAMLRRLAGSPVPPEDFSMAAVDAGNVGPDQPPPASPDPEWPEG
jgi:hypothetical protein